MKDRTLIPAGIAALLLAGMVPACSRIRTAPSCPDTLEAGTSAPLQANAQQPGAIPEYLWEILPADAGTIASPDQPNTTIQALREGEAVVRLTASDGLFQVINECAVTIVGDAQVAVTINVDPAPAVAGESVIILCTSTGDLDATSFALEQVDGPPVDLAFFGEGAASFTPGEVGTLTFECVGESASGLSSEPVTVDVDVSAAPTGGGRPPRGER